MKNKLSTIQRNFWGKFQMLIEAVNALEHNGPNVLRYQSWLHIVTTMSWMETWPNCVSVIKGLYCVSKIQKYTWTLRMHESRLERWFRHYEHWLFFQNTLIQFPASTGLFFQKSLVHFPTSTGQLTTASNSSSRRSNTSYGLCGHQA